MKAPKPVTIEMYTQADGDGYILVYDNPNTDTHLEGLCKTREEAEQRFVTLQQAIISYGAGEVLDA